MQIPIYTGIAQAAKKQGYISAYRAWLAMKSIDPGHGWILYKEAVKILCDILNIKKPRARQLLRQFDDQWWKIQRDRVWLKGKTKLVDFLDIDLDGEKVLIDIENLHTLSKFNAALFGSFYAKNPKTISRARLKQIWGVSKTTQIRYEKKAQITKRPTFSYTECDSKNVHRIELRENKYGQWWEDINGDGIKELVRQRPNQYHSDIGVYVWHKSYSRSGDVYGDSAKRRKYFDTFPKRRLDPGEQIFLETRKAKRKYLRKGIVYEEVYV